MILEKKYILYILFGAFIGYTSWNLSLSMVALSSLVFAGYFFIENRIKLFLFIFSYRLIASYGILFGLVDSDVVGYISSCLLWIFTAFLTTIPFVLLYSHTLIKKIFLFPIALILTIIPPIGIVDGVDPISAAGLFFPGYGYLGLVYYILSIELISTILTLYIDKISYRWVLSIVILSISIYFNTSQIKIYQGELYAYNTFYKHTSKYTQKQLVKQINHINNNQILLAENILGKFTSKDMNIWHNLHHNKTVYAGAHIYPKNSNCYHNVILKINKNNYKTLYIQRVPVPIAMWKPYSNNSACMSLKPAQPIKLDNNSTKAVFLICYEIYIPYIYLSSNLDKSNTLIAVANLWWSHTPSIQKIQHYTLKLWSKLFDLPYILSINRTK